MPTYPTPRWAGWLALSLVLIGTVSAVALWRMGFPAPAEVQASATQPAAVLLHVDWTPEEDDPGWDCRIHGNRICG